MSAEAAAPDAAAAPPPLTVAVVLFENFELLDVRRGVVTFHAIDATSSDRTGRGALRAPRRVGQDLQAHLREPRREGRHVELHGRLDGTAGPPDCPDASDPRLVATLFSSSAMMNQSVLVMI